MDTHSYLIQSITTEIRIVVHLSFATRLGTSTIPLARPALSPYGTWAQWSAFRVQASAETSRLPLRIRS